MSKHRPPAPQTLVLCLTLALASWACTPEAGSAEPAAPKAPTTAAAAAARFGEPLAIGPMTNLNRRGGPPEKVDLGTVLGSRPVLFFYWIPGHPRADEMLRELRDLVATLPPNSVALYGVVFRRGDRDDAALADRIASLGLEMPILEDVGFELGKRLRVQSVPNLTIVDREGRLRLTNGASLSQQLEYKMTLESAIRRVAESGTLGTYGFLETYYPVRELIGKKCPEFKAPLLTTSVEQSWSSMIRDDRLNVLIFWSVECPHCRRSLPELNRWLRDNSNGLNVITAAQVMNDAERAKTREFCDLNGFVFPTLVDQGFRIASLYQVTSTPTILIIRPDGVVDSVVLDASADLTKTLDERRKALL